MNLKGKVALVTGATDGVGRRVAAALGAGGAHVLVHGRDADRGGAAVKGSNSRAWPLCFSPPPLHPSTPLARVLDVQDHPTG